MLVALERALEWQQVIWEGRNLKSRMKGLGQKPNLPEE
jgi:hypothetical protein